MKIRTGFVSNSSSSSFCICGYSFDFDLKLMRNIRSTILDKQINLDFLYNESEIFLGKSYTKMNDDETLKEFKQGIKTSVESLNLDLKTYGDPDMILDEVQQ